MRITWTMVACPLFVCGALAFAQLSPKDALSSFQLADPSLHVELVAAEPMVESPCAIAFDEKGRLFVAENRGYPNTAEPPQGRIALLTDDDGDGRMDRRTTFADGFTYPNGVLPWRGGVIVTCAPDVFFLKDTDGDGVADERRVLFTGFDTKGSTQLRVNAPTLGPDGWIYLAAGLSGGSITCPSHPERAPLKMTSDVRFHADSLEIENVDGRSQYGMSFDEAGRRFICMNRIQVQHVVLSSKWLARNPHLAFSDTVQNCPELVPNGLMRSTAGAARLFPISSNITTADSHQGFFSAACAVTIWRGADFPDAYRGCAFSCDPTGNLVHADRLKPHGLTFAAVPIFEGKEFLASSNDWFRPVFLTNGPDDALTIADMTRKVIEHPDYLPGEVRKQTDFESGKAMGRIWRVTTLNRLRAKSFGGESAAELVARMASWNAWEAQTAFRLLIENRPPGAAEALRAAIDAKGRDEVHSRQIRALAALGPIDDEFLERLLRRREDGIRSASAWLVAERGPLPPLLAEAFIARAAIARPWCDLLPCLLALGECQDARALPVLAKLMQGHTDHWSRAAAESSLKGKEAAFLDIVLGKVRAPDPAQSGSGFEELLAEAAGLAGRAAAGHEAENELARIAKIDWPENDWRRKILLVCFVDGAFRDSAAGYAREAGDLANSFTTPQATRLAAIRVLSRAPWADAGPILKKLIGPPDNSDTTLARLFRPRPEEIRATVILPAVIRAIAAFDLDEAADLLLSSDTRSEFSIAQKDLAIGSLLSRPGHVRRVLDAIEGGRIAASDISGQRRETLLKHKDSEIRARAEKLFALPAGDRKEAFEKAKAALALQPDAAAGREVFHAFCSSCHRLEREGHAVGPDLFDIRGQTKENILFHIVAPDAEIAPAFAAYSIETKDGRTLAGLLKSESPSSITVRMPLAQEETIARTDIAKLEALPSSLMPAGLEAMGAQALADLLAFLKGEAAP